jgi:hypothetical protein
MTDFELFVEAISIAGVVCFAAIVIHLRKMNKHLDAVNNHTYYGTGFLKEIKQHITRPKIEDRPVERPQRPLQQEQYYEPRPQPQRRPESQYETPIQHEPLYEPKPRPQQQQPIPLPEQQERRDTYPSSNPISDREAEPPRRSLKPIDLATLKQFQEKDA